MPEICLKKLKLLKRDDNYSVNSYGVPHANEHFITHRSQKFKLRFFMLMVLYKNKDAFDLGKFLMLLLNVGLTCQ